MDWPVHGSKTHIRSGSFGQINRGCQRFRPSMKFDRFLCPWSTHLEDFYHDAVWLLLSCYFGSCLGIVRACLDVLTYSKSTKDIIYVSSHIAFANTATWSLLLHDKWAQVGLIDIRCMEKFIRFCPPPSILPDLQKLLTSRPRGWYIPSTRLIGSNTETVFLHCFYNYSDW